MLQKRLRNTRRVYQGVECVSSLFIFDRSNRFRTLCVLLIRQHGAQMFMRATVLATCLVFALETYDERFNDSTLYALRMILLACNSLIAIETVIQVIALGLWMDNGAYCDVRHFSQQG
jgi:hypothetical protein